MSNNFFNTTLGGDPYLYGGKGQQGLPPPTTTGPQSGALPASFGGQGLARGGQNDSSGQGMSDWRPGNQKFWPQNFDTAGARPGDSALANAMGRHFESGTGAGRQ